MSRRMVVLPYDIARSIIEPMQGDHRFDLKDNADAETINRLNKGLNEREGEIRVPESTAAANNTATGTDTPAVRLDEQATTSSSAPTKRPRKKPPPAERPATPKRTNTRAQVRLKLYKTNTFNSKTKEVIDLTGKTIAKSNIDTILDHIFGPNNSKHPTGSREVAKRLSLLRVEDLPNKAFQEFVTSSASTIERQRRWKKF